MDTSVGDAKYVFNKTQSIDINSDHSFLLVTTAPIESRFCSLITTDSLNRSLKTLFTDIFYRRHSVTSLGREETFLSSEVIRAKFQVSNQLK